MRWKKKLPYCQWEGEAVTKVAKQLQRMGDLSDKSVYRPPTNDHTIRTKETVVFKVNKYDGWLVHIEVRTRDKKHLFPVYHLTQNRLRFYAPMEQLFFAGLDGIPIAEATMFKESQNANDSPKSSEADNKQDS